MRLISEIYEYQFIDESKNFVEIMIDFFVIINFCEVSPKFYYTIKIYDYKSIQQNGFDKKELFDFYKRNYGL